MSKQAIAERITKKLFGKTSDFWREYMANSFRPMLEMMDVPEDLREQKLSSLVQKMAAVNEEVAPKVGVEVMQEIYTEEQLVVLERFHEDNPWFGELQDIFTKRQMEEVQKKTSARMEEILSQEFGTLE